MKVFPEEEEEPFSTQTLGLSRPVELFWKASVTAAAITSQVLPSSAVTPRY